MPWAISFHEAALAEANALSAEIRAKLNRVALLIAEHGLDALPPKSAKPIADGLWELRIKGKDGIARAFYVTAQGNGWRLFAFSSKRRKRPRRAKLDWRKNAPERCDMPAKAKLIPAEEVFAEWHKDPAYKEAYDALDEEFAIVEALMKARARTGLSQSQIAERMNTTQSVIARLEARAHRASLKTLRSYAQATGHRLRITLEPLPESEGAGNRPR